jgi:GxxExxY protein
MMHENDISKEIVDAAVKIHKALGPGLLESVYEVILAHELRKRGFTVDRQVPIPIHWDGMQFQEGFRADLLVQGKVIVEIKAVERVLPVAKAQTLTYLRLANKRLGLLLNFGEILLKDGITRVVSGLED